MTLIVSINGPESLWLLADRRLSYEGGEIKDYARKMMFLDTTDGVAILGYAGLGATSLGTEPADWMSGVLRGRNLPLERSLQVLADAMKLRMPPHLQGLPLGPAAHYVIIPAFVGDQARLYSIEIVLAADRNTYTFRHTRWTRGHRPRSDASPPRVALAGSGAGYLTGRRRWRMRNVIRLVNAHDSGRVSAMVVSDHLATLNDEVHRATTDGTVGPTCIVAWRHRQAGRYKGGGSHQFYTGTTRDRDMPSLPSIVSGLDMSAMSKVMMPRFLAQVKRDDPTTPAFGKEYLDDLNAELAALPDKPDEDLR
jgi:hypothetical protein